MSEFSYAVRAVRRQPAYFAVVAGMLALGIGATAAMFAIVRGVALRPLRMPDPDRLVTLWESDPRHDYPKFRVAGGNFTDWSTSNQSFSTMALYGAATFQATGSGDPEQLDGAAVDGRYFATLGVPTVVGRWLTDEDARTAAQVAVISYELWTRRFGRRDDVLGRTIGLDGRLITVVGVMPVGNYPTWPRTTGGIEFLPRYQQIWTPLVSRPWMTTRRTHVFGVLARLRPGIDLTTARSEMNDIARRLDASAPETNTDVGVLVTRLSDEVSGDVRPWLLVLLGAVGLVFAATAATLTNLSLLQSAAHQRELAVRAALGASRVRLATGVLLETAMIAMAGGLAGLMVAHAVLPLALSLAPATLPRADEVTIDVAVVGWAALMSLVAAGLSGAVPAWRAWRVGGGSLAAGERGVRIAARAGLRRTLVLIEVATAVVLLVGAGLAARSFWRLRHLDLGFSPAGVLTFELSLPPAGYAARDRVEDFENRLVEGLKTQPQVTAAAVGYDLPLDAGWVDSYRIEGRPVPADTAASGVLKIASVDLLRTLGVALVQGRDFSTDDRGGMPGVVIINEAFARREFRSESPIGRRVLIRTPSAIWSDAPEAFAIVGVTRDIRARGLTADAPPTFYLPARQFPMPQMTVFVHTAGDPRALASSARVVLRGIDATIPLVNVQTLDDHVSAALARPRFLLTLMGGFGLAVLCLALLGVYGLLSYAVAQRQSELAIRQALGARPAALVRLVLQEGLGLTVGGLIAGVLTAWMLAGTVRALLFGVAPLDPVTFVVAGSLVFVLAAGASLIPALRTLSVDAAGLLKGS